jgi:hypothetical protein
LAGFIERQVDIPAPSRLRSGEQLLSPPPDIALRAALYTAIRDAQITSAKLAIDLGVTEEQLGDLIRGNTDPDLKTACKAVELLGQRVVIDLQRVDKVARESPKEPDYDEELTEIVRLVKNGRMVFFLGAGLAHCDRPVGAEWSLDSAFLPDARELAEHLHSKFAQMNSEIAPETVDLVSIAQHVELKPGKDDLYYALHDVFKIRYQPTSAHRFIAAVTSRLRAKGYQVNFPLILTTNYDDLLERAFAQINQDVDVLIYSADGPNRGKWLHRRPGGATSLIDRPKSYRNLSLAQRPVILQLHGAIDPRRTHPSDDHYVISENHYIEYLTHTEATDFIPAGVKQPLLNERMLFLCYSLRDWNLRVILHRLSMEKKFLAQSWAVLKSPSYLDRMFWADKKVTLIDTDITTFIGNLSARLQALVEKTDE